MKFKALSFTKDETIIIEELIESIGQSLITHNKEFELESPGLMQGSTGQALFFAYLYKWNGNQIYLDQVDELLADIFTKLSSVQSYSLSSGLSGIGWAINNINSLGILEIDVEPLLNQLDQVLPSLMLEDIKRGHYDLISGSLGAALYCLSRHSNENHDVLSEYIRCLEICSVLDNGKRKWAVYSENAEQESNYDLGLCHGNTSILSFLIKAYNNAIEPDLCKQLIQESVNYLMSLITTPASGMQNCHWPSIITDTDSSGTSRLAWCYGDAGNGVILLEAAVLLQDEGLKEKVIEILKHTSERKHLKDNFIRDACLCHGTVGLVNIFQKAFTLSGTPQFEETAHYWTMKTFEVQTHKETGLSGFKTFFDNGVTAEYVATAGFLEGTAGIGIGLITAIVPELSSWNNSLLL
ncbi:MAG: hypothetical protein MK105_05340 [Crocinitomicaceae bacterium]|nr:hypothetical protein [Crocinitomicaceae bacterium]